MQAPSKYYEENYNEYDTSEIEIRKKILETSRICFKAHLIIVWFFDGALWVGETRASWATVELVEWSKPEIIV